MRTADVPVAVRAGRALRCAILVWSVTAQAFLSAVHGHRRELTLRRGMAPLAVGRAGAGQQWGLTATLGSAPTARRVRLREGGHGVVARTLEGKGVAMSAVGSNAGAEAGRRLRASVFDARLTLVAVGASTGRNLPDFAPRQLVATSARNALLLHVPAVTGDGASRLPGLLHIDAGARAAILDASCDDGQKNQAHQQEERSGAALRPHARDASRVFRERRNRQP